MDNYCLTSESVETTSDALPFSPTEVPSPDNVVVMKLKTGTQIANITRFAMKAMTSDSQRQIVFCGSGPACARVISAVEVFKRQYSTKINENKAADNNEKPPSVLHQLSRVRYRRLQDTWEPNDSVGDLEKLQVDRDIPAIYILLSKDAFDSTTPGHQDALSANPPRLLADRFAAASQPAKKRRNQRQTGDGTNRWKRADKTKQTQRKAKQKQDGGKEKKM